MTQFLPPNLLALFAPRDPMPFLPPTDKLPHEKKRVNYTGIAEYASLFEDPKDTPLPTKVETKDERKERKRRERAELQAYKIEQGIAMWDPNSNSKATSDPYKTLFVSRINYDTSESKLRREFEVYGPIRKIAMAYVKGGGKPRGYAFIEYEHERDMHAAYKHADGLKIDGRRVLVDVERGRTVKGWLPRRLGGGLGNSRRPKGPGGEFLDELRSHSREKSRESSQRRGFGSDRGDRQERRRSRSRDRSNVGNDRKRRSRSRSPDRDRRDRGDDRRSARGNGKEDRAGREERNRDDRGSRDTRERRDKDRRSERVSRDDNQSTESRGANNGDY